MDKEGNFNVIRRHCFEDEGIRLTEKQNELLERWNMVIELRTCESLKTKDIVQKLIENFHIERATAHNDVSNAEALFGYNITINKSYRIAARIEFLEEYIDSLKADGLHKEAASQEANLIKWFEQYPELKRAEQPRMLRFTFTSGQPISEDLPTIEDAEYLLTKAAKNG